MSNKILLEEMGFMLFIPYEETERLLSMKALIERLEAAYQQQANLEAVNRPRSHLFLPTKEEGVRYMLKTMEGGLAGGYVAARISSELVGYDKAGGNRLLIPSLGENRDQWLELVMLFRSTDGALLAIMPGGNIQRYRVAATCAVGAKYLAKKNSEVLGLFGTGWQASAQIMAYCEIFPIKEARVFSRNKENRQAFAEKWSEHLNIKVIAVDKPEQVAAGADIVATATNSYQPVLHGDWLEEGQFFTCVMSDVDRNAIERADRIIVHQRWGAENYWPEKYYNIPVTNKRGLVERRLIEFEEYPDLSDLVSGKVPSRINEQELLFFYTNQGWGIQFAAAAGLIYENAIQKGLGHDLPEQWFLQPVHP
jgi:alanine dehydrogenase